VVVKVNSYELRDLLVDYIWKKWPNTSLNLRWQGDMIVQTLITSVFLTQHGLHLWKQSEIHQSWNLECVRMTTQWVISLHLSVLLAVKTNFWVLRTLTILKTCVLSAVKQTVTVATITVSDLTGKEAIVVK